MALELIREKDGKRMVACVMHGTNKKGKEGLGVVYRYIRGEMKINGHMAYLHKSNNDTGWAVSMYGALITNTYCPTQNEACMAASKRVSGAPEALFAKAVKDGQDQLAKALKFGRIQQGPAKISGFTIDRDKPNTYELPSGYGKVKWKSEATGAFCTSCGTFFQRDQGGLWDGLKSAALHGTTQGHDIVFVKLTPKEMAGG